MTQSAPTVAGDLLPCPICDGANVEIIQRGTARQNMIIACDCGCRVVSGDVVGLTPVSEWRWNTRASARAPSGVDRREEVAIQFLAWDADSGLEWAAKRLPQFAAEPHKGDCPHAEHKGPITCHRCCADEAYQRADVVIALLNAPQSDGWRTDMENAPRDGRFVLLVVQDRYGNKDPGGPTQTLRMSYWDAEDPYRGWANVGTHWFPTHWMPLPNKPSRVSSYSRGGGAA